MKKNISKKGLILFLIFSISMAFPQNFSTSSYAKNKEEIKVYVDSSLMKFEVSPIIKNGTTLVPMRDIFEELGAEILWHEDTKTIKAVRDGVKIELQIGNEIALIDGKKHTLNLAPVIVRGKTLVPLRFISEGYGLNTKWVNTKREIRIYSKTMGITNKGREIQIGHSLEQVIKLLGKPSRIDKDLMKTEWYVYNNKADSYKDFIMVAIRDNRVVAFKTNSMNWRLSDDIKPGNKYLGSDYYKEINDQYKENDLYIEVCPYIKGNVINSIAAYEKNPNYQYHNMTIKEGNNKFTYYRPIVNEKYSEEKIVCLEKQIFDLTNVQRVNKGLKPLVWNDNLKKIAREHSVDMSKNNYFGHERPGMSFDDRMQPQLIKYNWTAIGENLVLGVHDSIGYVNAWYNSDAHRVNLLSTKFDKLGVGGYYNSEKSHIYFTQNFAK